MRKLFLIGWLVVVAVLRAEAQTCSGTQTLTESSGTFDDGSGPGRQYSDNLDCRWLIQPPGARILQLEFAELVTQREVDVLTIYDGPTTESPILGQFSGHVRPGEVLFTTQGTALVRFVTNSRGTDEGWTLVYRSLDKRPPCESQRVVHHVRGTIEDGSGSDRDYGNNLDCEWILVAPTGEAQSPLRIDFEEMDIHLSDSLTIYKGYKGSGEVAGVYRGNRRPRPLELDVFPLNTVTLVFRTDRMGGAAGWRLRYAWSEPDPSCSGRQTRTASQDVIRDKGDATSAFYSNNLECEWLIAPPGASSLNLEFDRFDTHSSADYVEIYRGDEALELNRLLRHSGRRVPESVLVRGGVALVRFVTDGSGIGEGWRLRYEAGGTARGQLVPQHAPLLVYPNPATDHCTLHWPAGEAARLTVVDAAGRVVASQRVETSAVELDIAAWARGLYALRLETASGRLYTGRLLKP